MAEKLYYSMGEVAEMFDVSRSLIRYWDSQFDVLKPRKNGKGNRMFRPEDIENFKIIYHLVKEQGMTLDGARRAMSQRGMKSVSRAAELTERLQKLRALLVEIRDNMSDGIDMEESEAAEAAPAPAPAPVPEPALAVEAKAVEEPKSAVTVIEPKSEPGSGPEPSKAVPKPKAEPQREDIRQPDLPFYEQTLF